MADILGSMVVGARRVESRRALLRSPGTMIRRPRTIPSTACFATSSTLDMVSLVMSDCPVEAWSWNAVEVGPGQRVQMRTLVPASSSLTASSRLRTKALVAP